MCVSVRTDRNGDVWLSGGLSGGLNGGLSGMVRVLIRIGTIPTSKAVMRSVWGWT